MSDEDGRNEEFRARRGLQRAGGLDLNWKLNAHTSPSEYIGLRRVQYTAVHGHVII